MTKISLKWHAASNPGKQRSFWTRLYVEKVFLLIFRDNFESQRGIFWRVLRSFLVGVFEEKARLLQWRSGFSSVQRDQSTFFCSFVQLLGREDKPDFLGSEKQESVGSSLALNHKFSMLPKVEGRPKGPPFAVFSALCDIFPKIFEFYQRVPP